jgi:hypothetical protein
VLKRFPGDEHGTNLFGKHPELAKDLAAWLAVRLAAHLARYGAVRE